ncbi:MAG: hypothetical protein ACK4ND_18080 [Cytophagaceae bacterium]
METFVEIEDRVRKNSLPMINERIEAEIQDSVRVYAVKNKQEIDKRIQDLDKEWSIERAIETTSSSLVLGGLALGSFVNKRWLALPGVMAAFLLQHALLGWSPSIPILRSFGFRTRKEIDWEKYALKALKGDFSIIDEGMDIDPEIKAMKALTAVQI